MPRVPGVGGRISERLRALGWVRVDGRPDVVGFSLRHRYDPRSVYEWLADRRTPTKFLDQLARDLGVTTRWLLSGEGASHASRRDPIPGDASQDCA
jgi:hypothetical protein